jgi:hypothetical protein
VLLKTIAGELMREEDQIAFFCTGPSSGSSMTWTSERRAIDNVVKRIAGSGLKASDILAATQGVSVHRYLERRPSEQTVS